jgi:hypothetical protein
MKKLHLILVFLLVCLVSFGFRSQQRQMGIIGQEQAAAAGTITKESNDATFSIQWKTCGDNGAGECDFNVTVDTGSGNDRLLLVTVFTEDNDGAVDVTDVKYNSTSCDAGASMIINDGGQHLTLEVWYCVDADMPASSGTYAVRPYLDVQADDILIYAHSLTGVKQTGQSGPPDDTGTDSCVDDACGNTDKMSAALTAAGNSSFAYVAAGHNDPAGDAWTGSYGETVIGSLSPAGGTLTTAFENGLSAGSNTQGLELTTDEARSVFVDLVWEPN